MKNIPFEEETIEQGYKIHKKGYKTPDGKVVNGTYTKFYKNGQVMAKFDYKDGIFIVNPNTYYWWSGILVSRCTFSDGLMHGDYKDWYLDGTLRTHAQCKDGHLQGELKRWYPSGEISTVCGAKNGSQHGECKYWLPNGKIWQHYHYNNGKKQGECKSWDLDGKITIERYMDGNLISINK